MSFRSVDLVAIFGSCDSSVGVLSSALSRNTPLPFRFWAHSELRYFEQTAAEIGAAGSFPDVL
jgi:hypothetical protein